MLSKITRSPYLNILSGFILLIAAIIETYEHVEEPGFELHHGILLFSIIHILKAIPEIMHGFKEIEEGEETFAKK